MSRRGQHICAGSFRRRPDAGGQRTPRSMSRRAPHVLTQGFGGRRPYAEQQRTATRMCRHLCAGSCRSLTLCHATADGHEVWAAVPRTHIAPGRLVAGHEGGPGKADGQKCGPPRPVRNSAGSWRSPAICRMTADGQKYRLPLPVHTSRGVFLLQAMKMGRATANGQKNRSLRPAAMRGVFSSPAICRATADGQKYGLLFARTSAGSWKSPAICRATAEGNKNVLPRRAYARGFVGL